MNDVSTIGLDLAKKVFQVHGMDGTGEITVRRTLRRSQVLAYFGKLGHTVRLIPPACAKAYVGRNKNDPADAAAICEAVARPAMRFVTIKTAEQQAAAGVHKVRRC